MDSLLNWLKMGTYAVYVWPAYGLVFCLLAIQLLRPWLRWKKMNKKLKDRS